MAVIEMRDLRKEYAGRAVVDGVDLDVGEGEVLAVLGRNGAGKTTTVECAVGLRAPDGGSVRVLGVDPRAERARVQQVVGVQLQRGDVHMSLTVLELLRMYRSFYHQGRDPDELVARLGLTRVRGTRSEHLSGGQLQRLNLALALVGRPRVAVLDELTTGLDPAGRRVVWALLEELRAEGLTVLLVTHLMEEAERLADRVAVLDAGRVVALGSPRELVDATPGAAGLDDAFLALTGSVPGPGDEDGSAWEDLG